MMAIRTTGSTNHVRRTANLPSATSYTCFGRSRIINDNAGTDRCLIELANTTYPTDAGAWMSLPWSTGNVFNLESTGPTDVAFAAAPVATTGWFFWAISCEGSGVGQLKGYWAADNAAFFYTATGTGVSFTVNTIAIHSNTFDEFIDAELDYAVISDRIWTINELWQQRLQRRPIVMDRLNCWGDFTSPNDLGDRSGQGRTWTAGGTLSVASSSQVPYVARNISQQRLNSIAAANDGGAFAGGQVIQSANDRRAPNLVAY